MITTRCSRCGKALTSEDYGRQAVVTVERYTDSGMNVIRRILCAEHERELMIWIETDETPERTAHGGAD